MNEEEFIENLNTKEKEDIYDLGFKRGFQKGKLEAIEDELRFLKEIEKGTGCIDTKMFLKLRIEQLQKEIGGMVE